MPITPSGAVSFSDLRTEFVGGSDAISLGDLYRGGSNIRAKHPTNTADNDAASVPESGALDVSDFYGQGKGFTFTYSTGGTDQNLSDLFGATDYAVDYPKNVVIPASVTLGTNNTSEYALEVDSGGAGTITITNNGSIIGAGGAGGGAGSGNSGVGSAGSAGGDAIKVASACTFVNNGSVLAGGGGAGGGGGGGVGGNLSQQTQVTGQEGPTSSFGSPSQKYWRTLNHQQTAPPATIVETSVHWGTNPFQAGNIANGPLPLGTTSITQGQYTYGRGPFVAQSYNYDQSPPLVTRTYGIFRTFPQTQQTQATGGAGGAGGSGGVGRGYNNPTAGSGASGSAGTPSTAGNGGAGASGGAGGDYGQAGASGGTGTTGTPSTTSGTAGGAGGSGGAAGLAVEKAAPISLTFTNNGTVSGTVQS